MNDQVLISAANLNDVKMQNTEDVTVATVCVKGKNIERKNGKKKEIHRKIVTARKSRFQSTRDNPMIEDSPTSDCAYSSEHKNLSRKNLKRKDTTKDQSRIGTELEKEGETSAKRRNFQEKNDSRKISNRKTARKEKLEDKSAQEIKDDPNTLDKNTGRNAKGNKNSCAKPSKSKPTVQSQASDDDEGRNLVLSDKDLDLYILGSFMLSKEVLKVCIQSIKSPSGASLVDIYKQIKTATRVELDYVKNSIDKFLKKAVESRLLHECTSHRYKI